MNGRCAAMLLLTSCASLNTNTLPFLSPEQTWADGAEERATIRCALWKLYDAEVVQRFDRWSFTTRASYPYNGYTDVAGRGLTILNADAPSAKASTWDHEAVHIALYVSTGRQFRKPQCQEDAAFLEPEQRFRESMAECRQL